MEPITMMCVFFGCRLAKWLCSNIDSVIQTIQLAWNTVHAWLTSRASSGINLGNIVKERMANGSYRVVAGIFNNGAMHDRTAWECQDMDGELLKRFGGKNRIEMSL